MHRCARDCAMSCISFGIWSYSIRYEKLCHADTSAACVKALSPPSAQAQPMRSLKAAWPMRMRRVSCSSACCKRVRT